MKILGVLIDMEFKTMKFKIGDIVKNKYTKLIGEVISLYPTEDKSYNYLIEIGNESSWRHEVDLELVKKCENGVVVSKFQEYKEDLRIIEDKYRSLGKDEAISFCNSVYLNFIHNIFGKRDEVVDKETYKYEHGKADLYLICARELEELEYNKEKSPEDMIEEIEEYCGNTSCKNCCVGGSIYCDTDKNEVAYESVKEVYDTLKEKGLISTKLKKEENGMNKYIKQFMEDNDLKVGEKFDISFSDTGPYVFDENGFLINSWNEVCSFKVTKLLYGELKVIKIKEKPVLTKDEIDILKAFKLLGYKYIGRYELDYKNNNILIVLTNPKNLTRSNFINKLNKSKTTRIDTERFTSIKVGYTYSIDELIGVEE